MKLIYIILINLFHLSLSFIFYKIIKQMEPEENKLSNEEVIQLMRVTKKSDPLFKPLKKLKSALDVKFL